MRAPTHLDNVYLAKRLELVKKVEDTAVELWRTREWGNEQLWLDKALPFVQGAIMASVNHTNAYFTLQARLHTGDPEIPLQTMDPKEYTVEALRGVPADEVYRRPFGALGQKMAEGMSFIDADEQAADYVRRLVATDMELAHVNAAKNWMAIYGDGGGTAAS